MHPFQFAHRCGPALAVMGFHAVNHNVGDHGDGGQDPADQVEGHLFVTIQRFDKLERRVTYGLTEFVCSLKARTISRYRYSPSQSIQQ